MKSIFKKYWFIVVVFVIATLLRFWKLDTYPALNADEASNAYDAYSLIQTGKDQHGNSWPINFQSFNDYKPGLYVYLDIPFVKFMGLTPLAARMPGAIAGVLSVLFIYLLVREIFKDERDVDLLSGLSAVFLTISPWHIHFSRGGWEVNVATFLILGGLYFLVRFKNSKSLVSLITSVLCIVLS
ncbi:MAG: phospholipid carrier-dependent glycosyltransferase, partial [Bacteroidales bacterium]|nr:phospholipid carrier-dependent glycosyltransferase [Bacteroidales bacterium]